MFNATFNNITAISWQFVHKGDIITINACTYFLNRILVYMYLPKARKYLYINLNISIFLPKAGSSLYMSVTIDFQIAIS
jgi:hypothetical protein